MDVSGDVADLMVKEGIQLTEASIKLLAAGGKNLAAFLWALSRDSKKLVGKTNMARLLRAMEALTPAQRELVRRVYFENEKISKIAREEGVSHVAIHDRLKRIYQKIKNNF